MRGGPFGHLLAEYREWKRTTGSTWDTFQYHHLPPGSGCNQKPPGSASRLTNDLDLDKQAMTLGQQGGKFACLGTPASNIVRGCKPQIVNHPLRPTCAWSSRVDLAFFATDTCLWSRHQNSKLRFPHRRLHRKSVEGSIAESDPQVRHHPNGNQISVAGLPDVCSRNAMAAQDSMATRPLINSVSRISGVYCPNLSGSPKSPICRAASCRNWLRSNWPQKIKISSDMRCHVSLFKPAAMPSSAASNPGIRTT